MAGLALIQQDYEELQNPTCAYDFSPVSYWEKMTSNTHLEKLINQVAPIVLENSYEIFKTYDVIKGMKERFKDPISDLPTDYRSIWE